MSEPATPSATPSAAIGRASEDAIVRRVETIIGRLLRVGVVVSLLLVTLGTAIRFAQRGYGTSRADVVRLTDGHAPVPRTIEAFAADLRTGGGETLIAAGLVLLIATPILRVVVSIIAFAIQRDATFVAITSVVLALLVASFLLGAAH